MNDRSQQESTDVPVLAFIGHHDADLMPHFFHHYRTMGAGSFRLVLHGDWTASAIESLKSEPNVVIESLETEIFSEVLKRQRLNDVAQQFEGRWILTADADEFLQLPLRSLVQTLAWLERTDANALQAVVVQRHAEDGALLEVGSKTDLDATFSHFNVHLAEEMGLATPIWKLQFPLARVDPDFAISRGSHFPPNPQIALHVPLRGATHHFKWRAQLRKSIDSPRGEGANSAEQKVYSEWLQSNGWRVPTVNSRPCSTAALMEQGLLVAPTRSQLRSTLRRNRSSGSRAKGRIALVSFELTGPDRSGGIATAVGALAEALSSDGHEVHILYCPYHGPKDLWPGWLEYWHARGVRLHYLPRRLEHGLWLSFEQFSKKVSDHLETVDAQVLHFVDADAYGASAAIQRSLGRSHTGSRIITTLHGSMTWHRHGNQLETNAEVEANLKGLKLLLQSTDLACHPSEYMRSWIHEHLQVVPRREVVVPNCLPGTSRNFKVPTAVARPVREIVFFGRLEQRKGLDRFAEAVHQLQGDAQEVPITLLGRLGDTESRDQIEELFGAGRGRLRLLTSFASFDATHYLKAHDCVAVVPSTLDNSPYTVFECLEAGVPLLTSSVGGIPDLIDPQDHKNVLRADDATTLAHALQDAISKGLTPGRLAFDPADAEQAHLDLHAREMEQARDQVSNPPKLDVAAVGAFQASARAPSFPRRVFARGVAAGRRLTPSLGSLPRASPTAPKSALQMSVLDEPMTSLHSTAVLMYHSIASEGSQQTSTWRVTPERFEQQLAWLRQTDHRSLKLAEIRRLLAGEPLRAPRTALLTFDDGYVDFYEVAFPLLQRYGFSAVVFAVTSRAGATSSWDRALGNDAPLMSWAQLAEISDHGIEIGSHAHDHKRLAELSDTEILEQLAQSQRLFTTRLGRPAQAIAYPFGSHNETVQDLAARAGLDLGFGTDPGRVSVESKNGALERLTVTEDWAPKHMARLLRGGVLEGPRP